MANEIAEAIRSASNLTAQLKQLDGMTNYGELLQAATALQEIAALLLVLAAAPAFAANFATCVLDKMPGTQNDVAAVAIYQVCRAKHGSIETVAQGSGRGIFSPDSGAECTAKKAGDTRSNRAAFLIGAACRKLYDEPNPFNQYDR